MKRLFVVATVAIVASLLGGCGGGGDDAEGGGGSGAPQSKSRPNLGSPPASARPITSRAVNAPLTTRSHVAYFLAQDVVDWWVLEPDPGRTYQMLVSPESGDQDLFIEVNGRWLYSDNWYLAEDSLTFTAYSAEPIYIAVYGYSAGSYRVAAYYY